MPIIFENILLHLLNRAATTPDVHPEVSWYLFKLSQMHNIDYNSVEMTEEAVVKIFQDKLNDIVADNLSEALTDSLRKIKLCTTLTTMTDEIGAFAKACQPSQYQLKKFHSRDPTAVLIKKLLELRDEMDWLKKSDYPIRWENGCVLC